MLADRLAEQARAASVRIEPTQTTRWHRARRLLRLGASPGVRAAARLLEIHELEDAGQLAAAVDASLAPLDDTPLDLASVLRAIQAAAIAADQTTIVFLDEIQRLSTDWDDADDSRRVQETLAEVMERPDGRLVVLLAGSERTAVDELLAKGERLHHDGMGFEVPAISNADWQHALPLRFAESDLVVQEEDIVQILAASHGHPQRTMRVCAHVQQLADGVHFEISDVLISQAIENARSHPSWSE
jgi:hypothetical protein